MVPIIANTDGVIKSRSHLGNIWEYTTQHSSLTVVYGWTFFDLF